MTYKEMRKNIEEMADNNYQDFVKALISYEKGIDDEKALDSLYEEFMDNDTQGLLNEEFDYEIDEMREQGLIHEEQGVTLEKDGLITIVGSVNDDVEIVELLDNQGRLIKAANFSVVSQELGKKSFHNCTAYDNQIKISENLKKGDYIKVFGKVRVKMNIRGQLYRNIKVLNTKVIRENNKENNKKSILKEIKKYKAKPKLESKRLDTKTHEKER